MSANDTELTKSRSRGLERILTTAILGTGLVIGVGQLLIHSRERETPAAPVAVATPPEPMEPAALKVLEAFYEAPDLEAKLKTIRDPQRVRPMLEDYHGKRRHPYPSLANVSQGQVADFTEGPAVVFTVTPFSGPRYPVVVFWEKDGFAVDWESLTAYGTMDWTEFLDRQPRETQSLRVYLMKIGAAGVATPEGYAAYRIEHRDSTRDLIAFAAPATAVGIQPLVEGRRTPAVLEMAWEPIGTKGEPLPVIRRLVANRWSL